MADVKYILTLQEDMSKKLDIIASKLHKTDGTVQKTGLSIGSMAKKFGAFLGARELARGVRNIAELGINAEQTEIAFGTFLGSLEKGKKVIADLNEFANVTPFTNEQIIKSGRALLSANIPADKLQETLKSLGDVAAGANVPIEELANIYAKSMNKGKLQAEELNQLAERGIPIIDQLSKQFGVTTQEVFKMGSEGKITSDVLTQAFSQMTSEGGKFFNLMQKQSESTGGKISTLQGKIGLLGENIGKKLNPGISDATDGMINLADSLIAATKTRLSEELTSNNIRFNAQVEVLKKLNPQSKEAAKIRADLNDKYKDYLPNLIDENTSLNEISLSQAQVNKKMLERIQLEAKRELIQETEAKAAKTEKQLLEARIALEEAKITGNKGLMKNAASAFTGGANLTVERLEGVINDLEKRAARRREDALRIYSQFGQEVENATNDIEEGVKDRAIGLTAKLNTDKKTKDLVSSITSAAPKVFNINITKLIGIETLQSNNFKESSYVAGNMVQDELLRALNQTQIIANQ